MNDKRAAPRATLGTHLRATAHTLQSEQPPADLQARMHATLRSQSRGQARKPVRTPRWVWGGVATACAAVFAWIAATSLAPVTTQESTAAGAGSGFVPVVASDRWREAVASSSNAWLVATEMPRSHLAALGLPVDPSRAGETVRAQLLMHGSGDVLAVRVIQ